MTGSLLTFPDGSSLTIIKPLVGYRSAIEQKLKKYPFEKNVFLMMRFRAANKKPPWPDFGRMSDQG